MFPSFLKAYVRPLGGLAALTLLFAAGQAAASAAAVDTTSQGQAQTACAAKHGAVAYRLGTLYGVTGQIFEWKVVGKSYPGDIGLPFSNYTCFDDVYVLQGAKYPGLVVLNYGDLLDIQGVTKVASLGDATKECASKNNHLAKHRLSKDGKDDFTEVVAFGERPQPGNPQAGDFVYLPMATESSKLAAFAAPSMSTPKVLYGCLGELTWAVTSVPIVSYDEYEAKVLALTKPVPKPADTPWLVPPPCGNGVNAAKQNLLILEVAPLQGTYIAQCSLDVSKTSFSDANNLLSFTAGSQTASFAASRIKAATFNGQAIPPGQLALALKAANGGSSAGTAIPPWASQTPVTCTAANPLVWVSLFSPTLKFYVPQGNKEFGAGPGAYACRATAVSNGYALAPF